KILLSYRSKESPVILARNLGREDERLNITTLYQLDSEQVDMLTIILIGSSETRVYERPNGEKYIYTPRGYNKKERL
ncbi:MAG: precorrin-3B C(17)-methyltransferase, partial [Pseudomonadota bacterium]|nr:precorrin-3B C(17)-methyltransferase [Pseudomonadota bacterium]